MLWSTNSTLPISLCPVVLCRKVLSGTLRHRLKKRMGFVFQFVPVGLITWKEQAKLSIRDIRVGHARYCSVWCMVRARCFYFQGLKCASSQIILLVDGKEDNAAREFYVYTRVQSQFLQCSSEGKSFLLLFFPLFSCSVCFIFFRSAQHHFRLFSPSTLS